MISVLINAYAVSPNWGSEPGVGWNWIINLAKYCEVFVITEGEWMEDIDKALAALPQKSNIHMYYIPVPDKVRRMCWNQGDWRFYYYYKKWQLKALRVAKEIVKENKIDIIHQLNMIGFREPGFLWKIPDIPFIWGPIGGMELMPMEYLYNAPLKQKFFNKMKNIINKGQYTYSRRVKEALRISSSLISAVKGVKEVISTVHGKESILINETGVEIIPNLIKQSSRLDKPLKIIWVGKFDFRKQLHIALKAFSVLKGENAELHIYGSGNKEITRTMQDLAITEQIANQCYWHGNVDNKEVKRRMTECDLLFFTSIMEATSTVVLEAISVGLPVLCFNTCGFGPIVKDFAGVTIELSNPKQSIQDFSSELNNFYNNRHILNTISHTILQNRERLSWDSKAQSTIEIYKKCLNYEPISANQ